MEALQMAGSVIKGIGGFVSARHNAGVLDRQALEEERTGNAQALVVRDRARKAIGEQIGAQFSNGFQGGTGSALDALTESQINATLDMLEVRRQAAFKAKAARSGASQQRTQGWFSLAEGLIGAGTAAAGQNSDWAAAKAPS